MSQDFEVVDIPASGEGGKYAELFNQLKALPPGKAIKMVNLQPMEAQAFRANAYMAFRQKGYLIRAKKGLDNCYHFWLVKREANGAK